MAAGLTRRSAGAATSVQKEGSSLEAAAMLQKQQQQQSSGKENENGSSNGNGNQHSNINGTSETMSTTAPTAANSQGKSIAERSQIPYSFAITYGTVLGLEWFGGLWRPETATHWWDSLAQSTRALWDLLVYTQSVLVRLVVGSTQTIDGSTAANALEWREIITTLTVLAVCLSLSYVFFVAPFRAGLWTGRKAKRHVFHRYMGLCYLIHYVLAWVEFFATSSSSATDAAPPRHSYLCHIIAVMGIMQGTSAYFSFKVLPELNDPGYYSDKAVLSRTFVHENMFFTTMAVFGSIYYNPSARAMLRSNLGGQCLEYAYVFLPYIVIRPWYPITRFSNAGQTYKGRTEQNKRFYETATLMVKIFYLWAKYFLGFFMNFMIFMDLVKAEHWPFMNGMLLLNTGTVSLSIFLHTLRFKKVLPAKLTMSIYLAQIYLTFSAIPTAIQMFSDHPKLCALCLTGLLGNATRSRTIHGFWCLIAMYLLTKTQIDW